MEVKSTSVDKLTVEDMVALEISAPYVRCLEISLYPHGRLLRLRDIGSVVNYGEHDWLPHGAEVMSYTMELMRTIQHVKELELESKCFDVRFGALLCFAILVLLINLVGSDFV